MNRYKFINSGETLKKKSDTSVKPKIKRKPVRKTCDKCGSQDSTVKYTTDPYESEINYLDVWSNWCESCLAERSHDI